MNSRILKIACLVLLFALAGCGDFGKVSQGIVVDYRPAEGLVTLIQDSNYQDPANPRYDILPPITVRVPANESEMGPAPEAGNLVALDSANRRVVIYDPAGMKLRTIEYELVSEQRGVAPNDRRVRDADLPSVDPQTGTVTVYSRSERRLLTFSVPPEYQMLSVDTWKSGDEVRYYFRDPSVALRLMNVTKTDMNEAGE